MTAAERLAEIDARLSALPAPTSRDRARFFAKIRKPAGVVDGCWTWSGWHDSDGYPRFFFHGIPRRAVRILIWLESGVRPAVDRLACHRCDNPGCLNPSHLFLGTPADNSADMVRKGRHVPVVGERCNLSKLTEADVRLIREAHAHGVPRIELARRFNTARSNINSIVLRKTWRHVA